jgi:2-dehydropantoate 2-reductase
MRILIVGAGAMGCRYGLALHLSGCEVTLYDVNRAHIDAVAANGLEVHSDGRVETHRIRAVSSIPDTDRFEYIFIFTKALHTASAVESLLPVLDRNTSLVTLQNGLGNIETISRFVPSSSVIAGTTNYAAAYLGPGRIDANGSGITKLQCVSGADRSVAERLAAALEAGGIRTVVVDDIERQIWCKVAFNAALNTLTAITGLTVGNVGSTPEALETAFLVAKDVAKVARSKRIPLSDEEVCDAIRSVMSPGMSSTHRPSMLQDVLAKRKTEIESICGKVLETGVSTGTETPYLRAVHNLVRAIESNYSNRIYQGGSDDASIR